MEKAKVFYTDFRTTEGVSQCTKLQKLSRAAGIGDINFEKKYVAIKMHFGELGNCAYLRPNYVRAVADLVRETGNLSGKAQHDCYMQRLIDSPMRMKETKALLSG